MLSHLALAATLATLVSYTTAAPVHGLEARQSTPLGEARQIRWLKTQPGGPGQAGPGEKCLQVNSPGFSSRTIGIGGCVSGGPGAVDGSGHPADAQLFYYNLGATKIKVQDTTTGEVSCVDFGNPSNGSPITIAACNDNAPGQNLYVTDDLHIAVENGPGQCMDVVADSGIQNVKPYGILKSLQSYSCFAGNENQIFIFSDAAAPPAPAPEPEAIPLGNGRQIRWSKTTPEEPGQAGPGEKCLQVNSPGFSSRSIGIGGCISGGPGDVDGSGHPADVQLFYYNLGATKIKVKDTASNEVFCVDFGNNPSNGEQITIATCNDNAPGQKLYITDDLHIAVENGPGQCMDVVADSGIQNVKPYGILKSVSAWDCVFGNGNQIFIFP